MKLSTMVRTGALGIVFSALVVTADAAPTYELTLIGDQPDSPGYLFPNVMDINNKGEVTVGSSTPAGMRNWVWKNGTLTPVSDLSGGNATYSTAGSINDRSDIAGTSLSDTLPSFRPYILRKGETEPEDLGTFIGPAVFAGDMNLWRQILLSVEYPSGQESYIQHGQNLTQLLALPGGTGYTFGLAINLWGSVVGTSENAQGTRLAVIWRQGQPTELGLPPNGVSSNGMGLNDLGYATAQVRYANGTNGVVLWHQGVLTELPLPSGGRINNRNQVIGNVLNQTPLLWEGGVVYDINDLIAPNDPLKPYVTLIHSWVLNDRGQLIVLGTDSRHPATQQPPYLLTPVSN